MRRPPLHKALVAAVRTFNRNPWSSARLELIPREPHPFYAEDGLWTHHGHAFVDDDRFLRAYERAVRAGGWDYGIRWRVHTILWAASTSSHADGAFVECGTGRGFMASAICDYLGWSERPFYLYDTFEPAWVDAGGARTDERSPYYASSAEEVRANFAEWEGVRLVVGTLPDTLTGEPERVAFLHVDLNHGPAEEACVRHFWPRLSAGAVTVFDDYGYSGIGSWEATRRAADRLSAELGFSILALPTGQGVVVKPASAAPAHHSPAPSERS